MEERERLGVMEIDRDDRERKKDIEVERKKWRWKGTKRMIVCVRERGSTPVIHQYSTPQHKENLSVRIHPQQKKKHCVSP